MGVSGRVSGRVSKSVLNRRGRGRGSKSMLNRSGRVRGSKSVEEFGNERVKNYSMVNMYMKGVGYRLLNAVSIGHQ